MTMQEEVLDFWFGEAGPDRWYAGGEAFDGLCRERFAATLDAAAAGAFDAWRETPRGSVALCILLDQLPRNIHRGTPRAFATDRQALAVAGFAVDRVFDLAPEIDADRRRFLYMPFEHSEDPTAQRRSVELFRERIGEGEALDYARRHLEVIERFGRFPHRNAILGRVSTPDELAYLAEPGSGF